MRASTVIHENTETIIESCYREIEGDPQFARIDLPRSARIDHLPGLLRQLVNRLDQSSDINDKQWMESARGHGKTRRLQGVSVAMMVEEERIFYRGMTSTVH